MPTHFEQKVFAQVDRLASEITYVGVGALGVKASLDPMGERAGGGGVGEHLKGLTDDWDESDSIPQEKGKGRSP